MNDYIATYAQIETLQNSYDWELQRFVNLYNLARDRDTHRGLIDIRNLEGSHHPKTWQNMSEIITPVRQINEITKREGQVVHTMASLPERMHYWHEECMPLAAQKKFFGKSSSLPARTCSRKATSNNRVFHAKSIFYLHSPRQ